MRPLFNWFLWRLFLAQIYLVMALIGLFMVPYALVARRGAIIACKTYCRWVLWTAHWMLGIETEVRGEVPAGKVIVAAKHQSFLDILMIFGALPSAKFIMKRELLWTPIIGLYAKRLGCIPVNRGKKGAAIASMVRAVTREFKEAGQLVIYPQGTRVAPGTHKSYKVGTAILYEELAYTCVPVATNVGLFWPKRGTFLSGLAVVEFLQPIPPGSQREEFLSELEELIESHSNRLMSAARSECPARSDQRSENQA